MRKNIPQDLASLPFWTSFTGKRPKWGVKGSEETGKTLADVDGESFGLYTSPKNKLVVIDIDHGLMIPEEFPPTYTEYSLSGNGIHLFYLTTGAKDGAKAQYTIPSKYGVQGEIFVGKHALRVTGNVHERSIGRLTTIDHTAFLPTASPTLTPEVLQADNVDEVQALEAFAASHQDITLTELRQMLAGISLSQTERVKAAWLQLTGTEYSHYEFWLRIGMGIHSLYNTNGGFKAFDEWSRTDPTSYDANAVSQKWASFGTTQIAGVSASTIKALYNLVKYTPEVRTAKGIDLCNTRNVWGFAEFYHLRILQNGTQFFLAGDEDLMCQQSIVKNNDILPALYGPIDGRTLDAVLTDFIQNVLYPRSGIYGQRLKECLGLLRKKAIELGREDANIFMQWVETADDDPEATFDKVFDSIYLDPQQDVALAKHLLYSTFMTIIKLQAKFVGPYDMNGGMLIFVGPEQCGKSGFFNSIIPQNVRPLFVSTWSMPLTASKEYRDFQIALAGKPILVIDEFDGILGSDAQASSFCKDMLTKNFMEFTPIYETAPITLPRRAMVFGSTNEHSLTMTKSGTRRLWIIRVSGFNWGVINAFNWRAFYKNLYKEYQTACQKGEKPWLISPEIVAQLNEENSKLMAKNSQDIELSELFPIEIEPDYLLNIGDPSRSGLLVSLKTAQGLIRWRSNMTADIRSKAQLTRALTTLCSEYLKPLIGRKDLPKWLDVTKGVVRLQRQRSYRTYYPLPVTEEELKNGAFNGITEVIGNE